VATIQGFQFHEHADGGSYWFGLGFGVFVRREVAAVWGGDDIGDAVGIVGEGFGVGAGDLERVEHHAGAAGFDEALAEGGDDHGDGDLDGVAVFEWREVEGDPSPSPSPQVGWAKVFLDQGI
jgi:hypothetical protein